MHRLTSSRLRVIGTILPDALVLGLACVVRFVHVLSSSFPLGDGGLFLLMVQRLEANGYAIPESLAYNGVTIPFAYPPLGFFAAGFVSDLSGANELNVMRFLPLAANCITVAIVWAFARSLFASRSAALAATFAFGMLPLSYRYFIMGAGITRSPGLLFAVATVWLTYLLCRRRHGVLVVPLGLAAGLTVLSHPNAAWFAAYSSGLVLLFFCRDRRTLAYGMLAAGVAIAFAAPWLALMISRHGVAPFVAASLSSSTGPTALELLATLQVTQEPLAPVLAAVAVVGVIVCARRGEWWLPVWLLAACLLDTRYSGTFAMVPLALLVGVAAGALTSLVTSLKGMGIPKGSRLAIHGIAAWICVLATAGALLPSAPLRALPDSDLAAMRWVAASTPADADFLVVAPAGVSAGSESEWFPVVANRRSLGTYQGLEWLSHAPGASPWDRYDRLQACGAQDITCLETWASDAGVLFDYVFVREAGTESLRASLSDSAEFALAFRGPDVSIFVRGRDR